MIAKLLFTLVVICACGMALWKGRGDERMTAAALLLAAFVSPFFQAKPFSQAAAFAQPETGVLVVDVVLLAYLIVLALRSDRFWPLYAAGFQIVGTTIHIARFSESDILPKAYAAAQGFWATPVLLALLAGTWFEARYRQN